MATEITEVAEPHPPPIFFGGGGNLRHHGHNNNIALCTLCPLWLKYASGGALGLPRAGISFVQGVTERHHRLEDQPEFEDEDRAADREQ